MIEMTRRTGLSALRCGAAGGALAALVAVQGAAQQAAPSWLLALELCVLPLEEVEIPDLSGLDPVDAPPDWVMVPEGGASWQAGDVGYVSLGGVADTEFAHCVVSAHADTELTGAGFAEWAEAQIAAGRYEPVTPPYLTHLDSTQWREPRLNIEFRSDAASGIVHIHVYEINAEA